MRYIETLKDGERISEVYLCKSKSIALTKTGKEYANVMLADKTGQIDSKIWDLNSGGIAEFDVNDYVAVTGQVTSYNGALQFKIESIIKGLQSKADRYIIKPFDVGVLKANITNVLAIRELIRKRYSQFQFTTEEENVPHPPLDLDQEFIIKVTETIKKNLSKELNVDTLCAAFNMSRSSFYNKIKALTNYSPSEFIRKVRMNEAAILLKSKKYTVSEVSDMLGFGDPKYFTDSFKKYFDVPPSVYMKQN